MVYNVDTPKNKMHRKDCTPMGGRSQLFLPVDLERIIEPEESVRLLDEILEQLDYTKLNRACCRQRKDMPTPAVMFKIDVYGRMTGCWTTRALESACKSNINFMWLLDGAKAPDHNTIARFRRGKLGEAMEDLFAQLVEYLAKEGELGQECLFIDGTKIEANANRYSFVWRKSVTKRAAKLEEQMEALLEELNGRYKQHFSDLHEALAYLEKQKKKYGVEFVQGRGRHKTPLQRDYETITEKLERAKKYAEHTALLGERNSYSKTDTDATFMHMKEDHMRNGQLKPGYNVQIGVDSEYIVNVGIYPERSDQLTLIPFLEDTKEKTGLKYGKIVADAGYESEENYRYLKEHDQVSYIKPTNYDKRNQKVKYKYAAPNFLYDETSDSYICPEGQRLEASFLRKSKSKSGYISEKTIYECKACDKCAHREECCHTTYGRRLQRAKRFVELREESLRNITTKAGILLRMNRSIQVEGAFGVIKQDYGFRRFLTRGKANVTVEMLLMCFAYNINKLHHKILQNRTKTHLFEKWIA